ncbi:hypothetical protein TNCV_218341 [Trichonephila clavipes]|nr:hypothetical protein TNCV_218341 [Trichonephila clavipes]
MRDSSVKTTSLPPTSLFHRIIWRWRRLWFCVKGRSSNGRLADGPLYSKGRQMVVRTQTLNDALQTQCAVLRFVMLLSDPSLPCSQFACPPVKWCTEVDVIDHVGPSYPPASNGHVSALQLLGFVNTTTDYR